MTLLTKSSRLFVFSLFFFFFLFFVFYLFFYEYIIYIDCCLAVYVPKYRPTWNCPGESQREQYLVLFGILKTP